MIDMRNWNTVFTVAVMLLCLAGSARAQQSGDPPQQMSLDQAVQRALHQNLQIALSRSAVATSEARISGAFGAFLPTLTVSSGYRKLLDAGQVVVIDGVPIPTSRPDNFVDANAVASLVLFNGFSNSATYSAARDNYNASVESLAHMQRQVQFQVRQAYLAALRSQKIVEVRQSDLDISRDRLARIRGRVETGTTLESQILSQESEIANRELELEQAATDALVARNILVVLVNSDPGADIQLSASGLADDVSDNEIRSTRASFGTLQQLLDAQKDNRHDLSALRLQITASSVSIEAASAGYWPSISTSLAYSWSRTSGQDPTGNTTLSIDLRYSPFDGFRTSEQVELARARKLQAEVEYEQTIADLRGRLRSALARLDGAERQIRAASRAVDAARQNRFSAEERYRLGAGAEADFILANSQYLTSRINQINAVFNYRIAVYELRYEIGE